MAVAHRMCLFLLLLLHTLAHDGLPLFFSRWQRPDHILYVSQEIIAFARHLVLFEKRLEFAAAYPRVLETLFRR